MYGILSRYHCGLGLNHVRFVAAVRVKVIRTPKREPNDPYGSARPAVCARQYCVLESEPNERARFVLASRDDDDDDAWFLSRARKRPMVFRNERSYTANQTEKIKP